MLILLHFLIVAEYLILIKFFKNKKYNKIIFTSLTVIELILVLGLRDKSVGIDTKAYLEYFDMISSGFKSYFEIGNDVLISLIFKIGGDGRTCLIIYAALTILFMTVYIHKTSNDSSLSLIIYESLLFFNFAFNGIREALALSIISVSLSFLIEKKYFKSVILMIVACLFHKTAFIFALAYVILVIKKDKTMSLTFALFAFLASFFIGYFGLFELIADIAGYSRYYALYSGNKGGYLNSILFLAIYVYLWYLNKYVFKNSDKRINKLLNILFIGCCFYIMAINFSIVNRLALYFTISCVALLPDFLKCVKLKNPTFLLLTFLSVYYVALIITNSNGVTPYIFNK